MYIHNYIPNQYTHIKMYVVIAYRARKDIHQFNARIFIIHELKNYSEKIHYKNFATHHT